MTKISAELIKKVREESGAPIARSKEVLEEFDGDVKKTVEVLKKEGFAKMEKRADRATSEGIAVAYAHHTGKVAVVLSLLCETDFVAKNELFRETANNIAMQIASMDPKDEEELLSQDFVKDPTKKISELIDEVKTKTGENVRLGEFHRVFIGE